MLKWCDEFEDRWQQTGKFPKSKELKRFKKQLMKSWEEKKAKAIEKAVDIDMTEDF